MRRVPYIYLHAGKTLEQIREEELCEELEGEAIASYAAGMEAFATQIQNLTKYTIAQGRA